MVPVNLELKRSSTVAPSHKHDLSLVKRETTGTDYNLGMTNHLRKVEKKTRRSVLGVYKLLEGI